VHSPTEENYIKTIYKLSAGGTEPVSTNAIADMLQTKAASVSDMLKKLSGKNIIFYVKYRGVTLTPEGQNKALQIIRKHRLWEVFLVKKLNFSWDEVHEVAEQMEHIDSPLLIKRLDEYLGFPKNDPHGDPIPTEAGTINQKQQRLACDLEISDSGIVVGVQDSQPLFLQHLNKIGISLGTLLKVVDKVAYDNSLEVSLGDDRTVIISYEVAKNIFISA
jgi:DtxR family Mn-dependent transcriptional regulator